MAKHKVPHGEDHGDHHDNHWHQQDIVLSCGTGSGLPLPVYSGIPGLIGTVQNSSVVGSVTLDTIEMRRPAVKIDFSCVVNFLAEIGLGGGYINILFSLSKVCEGDCIPLGTWNYQKAINLGILGQPTDPPPAEPLVDGGLQLDFRESFGFSWCECQQCVGCCTYLVEVADVQTYNVQSGCITNVSISALAVGC